jgi:hypothetical protein
MSTPETTPPAPADKEQRMFARTTNPVNLSEWLFRVVVFIVFVCSVSIAWWSLTHVLLPLQKQSRELSTRVSRMSSEVDDLEMKWNKSDASRIGDKFGQIHSGLFLGDQALGNWVNDLKTQATPLGLDIQADFGNTASPATNSLKLAVIPATVNVEVHPSSGIPGQPSAYQRIMQFSQFLTTSEKRADLIELKVTGGTNSIRHVVFVLNLWAGEEAPQ